MTVIEQAISDAKKKSCIVLYAAQFEHPGDAHLASVLVMTVDTRYIVWRYNAQDGGFYYGHYFNSLAAARQHFLSNLQ